MRFWKGVLFFILLAGFAFSCSKGFAGEKMTLRTCLRRAIVHNHTLRSFASERQSVAMEVKKALSPFYPLLTFDTSFARSDWEDQPRSDDAKLNLRAQYNLFRGGGDWANLKARRHDYQVSDYDYLEESLRVVASVEDTYFALLSLRNRLKVLKKSVEAAALHEKVARKRVEAGLAPVSDELRAKVDLANARVDLIRAKREGKTLKHALAVLMGVTPLEIIELNEENLRIEAGRKTLPELFAMAKNLRPVLKSYQEQVQKLTWEERSLKAEFFPVFNAYVEGGQEGPDYMPNKDYWSVGIELRYPFFSGFSTKYSVASARSKLEARRWSYRQKILEVQKEIADTYDQLKTDEKVIEAQRTLLKSALENLKVAQRRYEVGVGTIVELTDARVDATKAAVGLVNAKLTVVGDEVELRRVTGWFVSQVKEIEDQMHESKKNP